MTASEHPNAANDANDPILIAGGGIGGLTAALALARRGRAVHVLEKRQEHIEEGAGIQIGPNGSRILIELGLADAISHTAATPHGISIWNGVSGRALSRLPLGEWIATRHGTPYWTMNRQDLHEALRSTAAATPGIRISYGTDASLTRREPDRVHVVLSQSDTVHGPALIAADGIWSDTRRQHVQARDPMPMGKCAARAVIAREILPAPLSPNDVNVWLRPGTHVVHYPVRSGRDIAIVLVFDGAGHGRTWAAGLSPDTIRAVSAGFPAPLRQLLATPSAWRQWSLNRQSTPHAWVNGRIALLGDAAHPILPFLAQGAVLAMEDAMVLADELGSADSLNIPAALRRYEARRKPRARRVQDASERNGRIYHMDGLAAWSRDAVLAATPPAWVMAGYDWLYGWRV